MRVVSFPPNPNVVRTRHVCSSQHQLLYAAPPQHLQYAPPHFAYQPPPTGAAAFLPHPYPPVPPTIIFPAASHMTPVPKKQKVRAPQQRQRRASFQILTHTYILPPSFLRASTHHRTLTTATSTTAPPPAPPTPPSKRRQSISSTSTPRRTASPPPPSPPPSAHHPLAPPPGPAPASRPRRSSMRRRARWRLCRRGGRGLRRERRSRSLLGCCSAGCR